MPDEKKRSWRIIFLLLTVFVIFAAWSLYWFVAIGFAQKLFAEQRAKFSRRGTTLECTGEEWGGYPFRFEFSCSSPIIRSGAEYEGRATRLLAVALAYNPWQVALLVDGPSTITGLTPVPFTAGHQRALAALTFGRGAQVSISADLPKLVIPDLLSVDRIRLDSRPASESRTEFAASMERFDYRPASGPALPIEQSTIRGFLTPEGAALIDNIELSQSKLRLWGHGEITLDESRRPSGKISAETNDLNGLLAYLDPHLEMSEEQKSGLRTMLGLLGNEAKADIIAKEGSLFIGPFKTGELEPLF